MNLLKTTFILTLLTNIAFAGKSPHPIDLRYNECLESNNGTTANMNDCTSAATKEWDIELNKNYQFLLSQFTEEQKDALRTSQRTWIKFRDSEMALMRLLATGGTIDSLIQGGRYLEIEKRRALELKGYQSHVTPKFRSPPKIQEAPKAKKAPKDVVNTNCENTIFSCTIKNKKNIKVCKTSTDYIYQFGKKGNKPEIILTRQHKDVIKTPKSAMGNKTPESLVFVNKGTTYSVFTFNGRPNSKGLSAGVSIERSGEITDVKCHPDDIQTDRISAELEKAKLNDAPKFTDYPAESVYSGKNHALLMDEFGKQYKTRLRAAIKEGKPTFAGHYIVASWGCGTSGCNTGAIIDAKTGRAYPLPVAITSVYPIKKEYADDVGQEQIYKNDSRLMIFAGELQTDHSDGHDVVEFYEFDGEEFKYIKTKPYGRTE